MSEGQQCLECNGAICIFCPFNKIVNDDSKTFKSDHTKETENVF